jgi:hypothetical protein
MNSVNNDPKKAVAMMQDYCNWLLTLPVPEGEVINYLVLFT